MKKLLISLLILTSTLAYSKTTILETHAIEIEEYRYAYQKILCIDGYKYLLTYTKHDYAAVSTIQMFQSMGGYTVPISCKNK